MENQLTLTSDMQLVLGLTVLTMVLFLFERLRADVVALVVLVLLGLTGWWRRKTCSTVSRATRSSA